MKLVPLLAITLCSFLAIPAGNTVPAEDARKKAAKLKKDGNWKEAFAAYDGLLMSEGNSGNRAAEDLQNAWDSLNNLRQPALIDSFLEKVISKYPTDWRVLARAGNLYMRSQHWGVIIAGEFKRGHHRGGGKHVNTQQRDRVRALALMERAMKAAKDARAMREAMRLKAKADFDEVPSFHSLIRYLISTTRRLVRT